MTWQRELGCFLATILYARIYILESRNGTVLFCVLNIMTYSSRFTTLYAN